MIETNEIFYLNFRSRNGMFITPTVFWHENASLGPRYRCGHQYTEQHGQGRPV